ncbi:MAG: TspO/MBR family protein [Ornithinimicrobium sp.]|uniref:TspO/MBR family protein n=1 Tax=Ornithinimicrobium sp. TaxID=1977084 RepID=UPI003D9BC9FF
MAWTGLMVVLLYAVGSGWWTSREPGWYAALVKPRWQPPDWVFGVIWPLNFLALGIAAWVVGRADDSSMAVAFLGLLVASSALALLWACLFYVPHRLRAGALALTAAAMLACALPVVAWMVTWWVGLILVPYAVWLSVAGALSWAYAGLNPAR